MPSPDETTPILGDIAPRSTTRRTALTLCVVALVALAGVVTLGRAPGNSADPRTGFRFGQTAGMNRYLVKTRCISDATKASAPAFFREGATITGAMIVRHNVNTPNFFTPFEPQMMMMPVTYEDTGWEWDWEEGRFYLDTDRVDGEWGFALINNFNETFYEVGSGADAPLWGKTCPDLVRYDNEVDQFFNRDMARENATTPNRMEYVFGECARECPVREFMDWTHEQRELETARTVEDPPNELGSEFVMYGLAGNGVCGMDLYTSGNGGVAAGGDIIMHFLPLDYSNSLVLDNKLNGLWFTQQMEPWVFGPRGDTSSTQEWRMRVELKESFFDIQTCTSWADDSTCTPYTTYNYRTGAGGYSTIDGIKVHAGRAANLIRAHDCAFYSTRPGPKKNDLW